MDTKEVLVGLRKEHGLTQEDMAERLFVTRQAVSRWETGETVPNTETIKLISKQFDISINTLLGQPQNLICQSCAMPLATIDDFGTEDSEALNLEYCSHCYRDGSFTHNRTIDEMVDSNLRFLDEFNAQSGTNFSEDEARLVLKAHLATLKRWTAK